MALLQNLRQQAALGKKLQHLKLIVRQGGVSRAVPLTFSDADAVAHIDLDGGATLGAGGSSTGGEEGGGGADPITQQILSASSVVLDGAGPDVLVCTPGASLTVTTANLTPTLQRTLIIPATNADVPLTFPTGWIWGGFGPGQAPQQRMANREAWVTIYSVGTTDADVRAKWDTQA
jgi:hypothetical protein